MTDWLANWWSSYSPQTVYDWQTVAATLALISSAIFVALYSRVTWWRGNTGRNLMAMGLSLLILPAGSVIRRLIHVPTGHVVLLIGWLFVAVVMAWRTSQMWRATHPRNAPPPTPLDPRPPSEGRHWYTPTPHSIIENPPKEKP